MARRQWSIVALLLTVTISAASAAQAQERPSLDLSAAVSNALNPAMVAVSDVTPSAFRPLRASRTSPLMTALYASTFAMQALDVHSTITAFRAGAVEANPLMTGVTKNTLVFAALKAGIATSTVLAARSMSKTNKVAAVATLIGINSAYAMIVQHNYKVASHLR
jgi:Domain of unknown function (DUF5658)